MNSYEFICGKIHSHIICKENLKHYKKHSTFSFQLIYHSNNLHKLHLNYINYITFHIQYFKYILISKIHVHYFIFLFIHYYLYIIFITFTKSLEY